MPATTDQDARNPVAEPAGPRLEVAIHILADGSVVFGDLPASLVEVARVLGGEQPCEPAALACESGESL